MRAGLVEKEEEYVYSSCGDFYGMALELSNGLTLQMLSSNLQLRMLRILKHINVKEKR